MKMSNIKFPKIDQLGNFDQLIAILQNILQYFTEFWIIFKFLFPD